jgi:hypothetical protein
MNKLRVRVYNVRFGDAVLISIPDAPKKGAATWRHILIDVGNSLSTEGGVDTLFRPVLEDVLHELAGQPLDLYIMTHEHMDHVQGLLYGEQKIFKTESLKETLNVRHSWLTASAHPQYYETHTDAKKRLDEARFFLEGMRQFLKAAPEEETDWIHNLMGINNPRATDDCVDYLRELTPNTWYVYNGIDLAEKHPFQEAEFEIWGPEEDSSIYYGRFQPVAFGLTADPENRQKPTLTVPKPPPGVDAGAFYSLVEQRRRGYADNLLAIDKANNNTSIVLCLKWRGWKLLFPADAEQRSWQEMDKRNKLSPVDFLKISHHGSATGTPPTDLLDKILPADGASRYAVLSAYPDLDKRDKGQQKWVYEDVPEREVLEELQRRAVVRQTKEVPDGGYIDYLFDGKKHKVTIKTSA